MSVRYGNKPTKWTADVEGWPHADPDRRWGSQRYWTWVVDNKYPFSLLRLQDQNQREIVCDHYAVKTQHGLMHYVHDGDAAFWTLQELPEFRHHDQDYAHQDCGTMDKLGGLARMERRSWCCMGAEVTSDWTTDHWEMSTVSWDAAGRHGNTSRSCYTDQGWQMTQRWEIRFDQLCY